MCWSIMPIDDRIASKIIAALVVGITNVDAINLGVCTTASACRVATRLYVAQTGTVCRLRVITRTLPVVLEWDRAL